MDFMDSMVTRCESSIRQYFASWLTKDETVLSKLFSKEIEYTECYGPQYHGIEQVGKWVHDWNQHGSVLQWQIKQILHQDNCYIVEWYFECEYEKHQDGFDGVSLIEFNEQLQMISIKEFQSKAKHYAPYETLQ